MDHVLQNRGCIGCMVLTPQEVTEACIAHVAATLEPGQHIDFAQLTAELEACLLNDAEMALGSEAWRALPDPFGPWHEAV
mgnify:CR=1 FL=1